MSNHQALKIRMSRSDFAVAMIFFGIILYPIPFRSLISEKFSPFNPFLLIALGMVVWDLMKKILGNILTLEKVAMLLAVGMMCVSHFLSNRSYGFDLSYTLQLLIIFVFPYLMISQRDFFNFKIEYLRFFLKIFSFTVNIIILIGILNYINGNFFNQVLFELVDIDDSYVAVYYRMWSIYGHPLYNSLLVLLYYTLNYIYTKYFEERNKKKNKQSIYIILSTLVGLILTASKAALIVYVLMLLFLNYKNLRITFFSIVFVLIANFVGAFDTILERFTKSFSSSRFESYARLSQFSFFKQYKFFRGYGTAYEFNVYKKLFSGSTAAFELPILSYALDYGILYVLLFLLITVVYPVAQFLKFKQYDILVAYLGIVGFVNTYNGITLVSDYLFIFVFIEVLFLYLSDRIRKRGGSKL